MIPPITPALRIPYATPEEYELQILFERLAGNESLLVFLPTPKGGGFYFSMGAYRSTRAGFGSLNGQNVDTNPASIAFKMENGKRYKLSIEVRRAGFSASVDGKRLIEHKSDYSDTGLAGDWPVGNGMLAIGTFTDRYRFYELRLIPISGTGHALK